MPSVFASTGVSMNGFMSYALPKGMVLTGDGKRIRILGTPGGVGSGDRLGGMQRDDSASRPREGMGVASAASRPEVETFLAGVGRSRVISTETFPGYAGRSRSAGPTILMAKGSGNGDNQTTHVGSHQPHPAPKTLPEFPDAVRAPEKTPVQGGGHLRKRWKDDKFIYEFDSKKNAVEKYNKTGKIHLGEFDYTTGRQTGPNKPNRTIEP